MNKDISNTVDEEDDIPPTDGYNHHTREEDMIPPAPIPDETAEEKSKG